MNESELAKKLASAKTHEQAELLQENALLKNVSLAEELKKLCYEAWTADPEKTNRIISAFNLLSKNTENQEITAYALWSSGIGEILNGQMRDALDFFNRSEAKFLALNKPVAAAETQVGKLYALAVLGLYDEAVKCGLNARDVFLQVGNDFAAGKIEHNLGNLYQRRDQYEKAEFFLRNARLQYERAGDFLRLIQTDNSLANALAHQHRFREAEEIYKNALENARKNSLEVTTAEIESNLGHLLTFQGRLDAALKFFESSRRRYENLNLPHQTAIAELEIADSYLELNLAPESAAIYEKITAVFDELGMNAEKAKTLANFARSCAMLGETKKAHDLLSESQSLFAKEKNFVGAATVKFTEAKLFFSEKNYREALEKAASAEKVFTEANFFSRALHTRWLRGELSRLLNENLAARHFLETALEESKQRFVPQITLRCCTSLGQIEAAEGNSEKAETHFKQAISMVEEMRSPLPAEDFRTAFLADKLTAYHELIGLYLSKNDIENLEKAFVTAENARSRVLHEMLEDDFSANKISESRQDLKGIIRLEKLREELNWLYSRLNRLPFEPNFDTARSENIQKEIRERENETLEINRKQGIFADRFANGKNNQFNLATLQNKLGDETALIEFINLDGKFSAFIITNNKISALKDFSTESEIFENLENLRFQIDGMKSQAARKSAFQNQMLARTKFYLAEIYKLLLKPLENFIGEKNLVIVPHGILHYLPFHALFDGEKYLIENREISYAPSAQTFLHCLEKRKTSFKRAVLIGVEDELTPNVGNEINKLGELFPSAEILLDETATTENLKRFSAVADILHLACHGKFRPDNPLFSSLQLYQSWFNVRDAYELKLDASLVVLSACETGINAVAVGDELLGLTRGFLSAGASSLVLSLWQIDDETTARFMSVFYENLQQSATPATAFRLANIKIMETDPHPFFWSPFVLIGGF